jgi:hypothetical protein
MLFFMESELPTFEILLPDESACEECGKLLALDIACCPDCGANTYRLTFDGFYADFERLKMMDGRYGGLVLGRDGPDDDIPMYICRNGSVYTLVGLMQGGEYLMSRAATNRHLETLKKLNAEKGEGADFEFSFKSSSSVINTNFMPPCGGLWVTEAQYVINRYATKIHFETLEKLNNEANFEAANANSDESYGA